MVRCSYAMPYWTFIIQAFKTVFFSNRLGGGGVERQRDETKTKTKEKDRREDRIEDTR